MSFRIPLSMRSKKAARFIAKVHDELQRALVEERDSHGLTQQQLAEKLNINRSVVNRQILGKSNLTLRSIADLAWGLNREIIFTLRNFDQPGQNQFVILDEQKSINKITPSSQSKKFMDFRKMDFEDGAVSQISFSTADQ